MTISLYDLLDVDEDATPDEIRAAWKSAIADLDPTDRKFRAFNDAAGVLLDSEKRAAYDAEIATARADESPAAEDQANEPAASITPRRAPSDDGAEVDVEDVEDVEADASAPAVPAPAKPEAEGPPLWLLVVAALLAVLSAALLIVVASWPGSFGGTSPAEQKERAGDVEVAAAEAENAAVDAVPVVLSYDYRTFDEDIADASSYLTEDFATDRTDLLTKLRPDVVKGKVVVTALVSESALTRVSEDGGTASIVVYIEQDSQHGKSASRLLRSAATVTMVQEGQDWLIDNICTEGECG